MILKKGVIFRRVNGIKVEEAFEMRFVTKREIDSVLELQAYIYNTIQRKEIFVRDTSDELIDALNHGGKIFGVFNAQKQLISYRFISFPGFSHNNMAIEVGLAKEEYNKVVHLETTVVHPDYRGNRLQRMTLDEVHKYIAQSEYSHLICTVSPYNIYSLKNIMNAGLQIKSLKKKYGNALNPGVWRFILHKDLNEGSIQWLEGGILFDVEDLCAQKYLIEKGYIGYKLKIDSKIVHYKKIISKTSSNSLENATFVS